MNLRTILSGLNNISCTSVLDRDIKYDGTECNVSGFLLTREGKLIIPIFQYDERYRDRCENEEFEKRFLNEKSDIFTNRDRIHPRKLAANNPFDGIAIINIAGKKYKVEECTTKKCGDFDYDINMLMFILINAGWHGYGISEYNLDYINISLLTLEERFTRIPDISTTDALSFTASKRFFVSPTELQLELVPDSDYSFDSELENLDTGERYQLHISSVTRFDPYKEIRNYLNTPGLDRDAQSDIALIMTDHMMKHANDTPQFEITYTCAGASLIFHERAWLDSVPQITTSVFLDENNKSRYEFLGGSDGSSEILMNSPSNGDEKKALLKYDSYTDGNVLEVEVTGIISLRNEYTIVL